MVIIEIIEILMLDKPFSELSQFHEVFNLQIYIFTLTIIILIQPRYICIDLLLEFHPYSPLSHLQTNLH